MTFAFNEGTISLTLEERVYSLQAIQKSGYKLAQRFTLVITSQPDGLLEAQLLFPPGTNEATAREGVRLFFEDLLDQSLREKIASETAPLRAVLLAHAFSRTDLLKR